MINKFYGTDLPYPYSLIFSSEVPKLAPVCEDTIW